MSLVEVLIALLLLGIVLSAAASSLIQFMRTATDNERRVQATALLNRLHEELQSLPWHDALLYESELQDVLDDGFEGLASGPPWTFEGEELVTLPGPEPDERRSGVPDITVSPDSLDGRDYEVFRFITWSDEQAQLKRFTTIVRWRLYDRVYEERFFSERAATGTEAGDPEQPRVVQFQVGPSPMELEYVSEEQPAQNARDIHVTVRFSEGVDTAAVRYRSLHVVPDETMVLQDRQVEDLSPYITDATGRGIAWRGTIPAGSRTFPDGTRNFRAIGSLGGEEYAGATTMVFTGGDIDPGDVEDPEGTEDDGTSEDGDTGSEDEEGGDPYPELGEVEINSALLSDTSVCLDKDDHFVHEVKVTVSVDGLHQEAYNVSATYSAGNTPRNEALQPVNAETFGGTNALFTLTLAAGVDHGFNPRGANADTTDFVIRAQRSGSDHSDQMSTQNLSVYSSSDNRCK